ncbi:hypothetical protein [Paenibacillus borealis]|uniref:Type 4 fimbrial biogenesis protein PilX N-terminal domain-containing protein n=1 Tax=Paenibacillus borealis TaxID=160799 RepID=A0A089MXX6_PAEBO|nr:hypothetical protein [Paenibacillus borealis]AIQ61254.1 hypothetical protein PBOR_33405 [Paenibacillus borealis]
MKFSKKKKGSSSQFVANIESERGSALVLVMFVVLLLTILGLAVLGATVGGAQRSETRENDVQSLHLAQKGLNEAAAYIQSELQGLKLEDIDPQSLGDILGKLDDNKSSLKVATELQSTSSGSVDGIEYDDNNDKKIGKQSIQYTITISSKAVVNGVERTLRQQVIIDSYPDFLKYVFGSQKTLRLNGSPILKGNVYAGEKLLVTNTPWYTYLGRRYPEVTLDFPKVTSNADGSALGEIHVQAMDNIKYKENFQPKESVSSEDQEDNMTSLPGNETARNDILNKILHVNSSNIKIKEKNKFVQINVEESFFDKLAQGLTLSKDDSTQKTLRNSMRAEYNQSTAQLNSWIIGRSEVTHIQGMPVAPVKVLPDAEEADIEQYERDLNNYNMKLQQLETLDSTMIFNGNLVVDGLAYKKLFYPPETSTQNDPKSGELPRWFIVAGNLEINNFTADFLPVRANILVTGNVKIKGNVEFDSTMLVLGETTVEDANIKGIRSSNGSNNEETKELVLISKGKVLINRLHAFAVNEPSVEETMEAFFYTDSSGELYGVGSMFHLIGGFFAKDNLTVNAVTGKVVEPDPLTGGSLVISQTPAPERFVIDYKPDIYENQQSSLPRVQTVNVNVGPMQLVN